ncbi:MAG: hypothetical protein Q9M17_05400 [Mariprofundus sp.]|nr:hypothetical protein [Mariprofundus sp.]
MRANHRHYGCQTVIVLPCNAINGTFAMARPDPGYLAEAVTN